MEHSISTYFLCKRTLLKFITCFIVKYTSFCWFTFLPNIYWAQCNASFTANGANISDNGTTGIVAWTNPNNASTSNNVRTAGSVSLGANVTIATHYLYARDFGFNVPAGTTVCGIELRVERKQQGGGVNGSYVRDNIVRIVQNGNLAGSNHANPANWSTIDAICVYGGPNDLWNCGWTSTDINSGNFGFMLSATIFSGASGGSLMAEIDHVTLTVYYTAPLPIELLYFKAEKNNAGSVALNWSTATETNNNYFVVERSRNAIDFEVVTEKDGAGNSLQQLSYSVLDEDPYTGLSYYRLKQVDHNGSYSYSQLAQVNNKNGSGIQVNSTPGALLVIFGEDDPVYGLDLINMQGQKVWSLPREQAEVISKVKIDASDLPLGIYFVKATLASKEHYSKVFLVKE